MANPTDSWRIKAKTFFTVRSFKRFSINENKVRKSQPENVNPSSSEEVEHITFNTYNYNKNKRPNSYYTMKKLLVIFKQILYLLICVLLLGPICSNEWRRLYSSKQELLSSTISSTFINEEIYSK